MKYSRFFKLHKRLNGKNKIAIIKGELLTEFVNEVVADEELDLEYKAFLLVSLSGGMRVTEALALNKRSFYFEGDELYFDVDVLKKRSKVNRMAKVHPAAVALVRSFLNSVVGKPFKLSPSTALRKIKALSGFPEACSHALRHSLVSHLLFSKNMTHFKASRILNISVKSMEHYALADGRQLLKEVF